jgi:hypothetical protein
MDFLTPTTWLFPFPQKALSMLWSGNADEMPAPGGQSQYRRPRWKGQAISIDVPRIGVARRNSVKKRAMLGRERNLVSVPIQPNPWIFAFPTG